MNGDQDSKPLTSNSPNIIQQPTDTQETADENDESDLSELPDGGYGWVIAFASFMCHFVADGIAFTFGVLYAELLEQFGETKSKTAWVGSLFVGIPLIMAPLAGFAVNRYGCRTTTIFGAVFTSASLAASSLATSIDMLCVTYGFAAGFGMAFVYVPATVIPSFWFEKKRALATGIAVSGSGVGTFAMAPLLEHLIAEFGWRGTLLISAGISLHMMVFGVLFQEYVPDKRRNKSRLKTDKINDLESNVSITSSSVDLGSPRKQRKQFINTSISGLEDLDSSVGEKVNNRRKRPRLISSSLQSLETIMRRQPYTSQTLEHISRLTRSKRNLLPASRMDIASVLTLAEHRTKLTNFASCPADLQLTSDGQTVQKEGLVKKLMRWAKEGCDPTLFTLPVYTLFFSSSFLLAFGYDFPYIYLPDYAEHELKINKTSFLISIIGIVNTMGQVIYGFIGDLKRVDVVFLYGSSVVICGILMIAIPFMTTYGWLAAFAALFGFFISASFSLETIVVISILSLDELTKAYSLLLFGQGVASLVGPPIGGFLWDMSGNYASTFCLGGVAIILSGVLALIILAVRKKNRFRTSSTSSEISE